MTLRLFAVSEAYYVINGDDELIEIAGVPAYGQLYFGEYTGRYPYQAAHKAFTGLQKYMKRFHRGGRNIDKDWFPGYDPANPPMIVFRLVDLSEPDNEMFYRGVRLPHHQGERTVVNADGRTRTYRWESKVDKIDLDTEVQLL